MKRFIGIASTRWMTGNAAGSLKAAKMEERTDGRKAGIATTDLVMPFVSR